MAKHSEDILTWARRGAEARWHELQAEVAHLVKSFPHLGGLTRTTKNAKVRKPAAATPKAAPAKRKRSTMSAAQKKAVSARMKKYWAARRKAAPKLHR